MPRPPKPVEVYDWYSNCSAHQEYNEDCTNCNAGKWLGRSVRELENWLWNHNQQLWMLWANRDNTSIKRPSQQPEPKSETRWQKFWRKFWT